MPRVVPRKTAWSTRQEFRLVFDRLFASQGDIALQQDAIGRVSAHTHPPFPPRRGIHTHGESKTICPADPSLAEPRSMPARGREYRRTLAAHPPRCRTLHFDRSIQRIRARTQALLLDGNHPVRLRIAEQSSSDKVDVSALLLARQVCQLARRSSADDLLRPFDRFPRCANRLASLVRRAASPSHARRLAFDRSPPRRRPSGRSPLSCFWTYNHTIQKG